jgi:integrase
MPTAEPLTTSGTLRDALAGWKKARNPSPGASAEYERAIRLFIELHGDLPVEGIKRSHARQFREALQEVPRHRTGKLLKALLPELVEWTKKHQQASKISRATVNKLFGGVQTVAVWARDNGMVSDDVPWADPFSKMRLEEEESGRALFALDDLNKLFASTVFTKGDRPAGGKGEAAFWLPLLSLFTGARQGELAGLTTADIEIDDITKAPLLIITEQRARGKRLKTKASVRAIPIHKELIRLGFLDYVELVRRERSEDAWLFPLIAPEKGRGGVRAWSKWFNRHLRALGVTDHSKVFHSFRHGFTDALRATGISTEGLKVLLGHSDGATTARYGAKEKFRRFGTVLVNAIDKVEYPGLDLSNVQGQGRGFKPAFEIALEKKATG